MRALDKAQLTGDDKKQRDHARSLAQTARKLLQDGRAVNETEAASISAAASKEVGALVRRELKLDALISAAEQYRRGDTIAAVQALSESFASDLDLSVRYLEDNRDRLGLEDTGLADVTDKTLAALALAESEVAFRWGYDNVARLACVRRLLGVVDPERLPERFVQRWYVLVAGRLQGDMHLVDTMVHLEAAVGRFPRDPDVLLVSGAFYELLASRSVTLPAPDEQIRPLTTSASLVGKNPNYTAGALYPEEGYDRLVSAKKTGFTRAEEFYRRVLALEANNAEAHLRLGRILSASGRLDEALAEVRLASSSPDPRTHYLAAMFEGAVHETAGKPDAAVGCYEEARRTCPRCPSAGVALSHAQRRGGDPAAATRSLAAALARDAQTLFADYWWDYPLGAFWQRELLMRELRGGLR